jgi:predicted TIM-barrel fold metal-dependent hydrolase
MNREESEELLKDSPSSYDADARVAFCDQHGIDVQFLNSTLGKEPFSAATRAGRPDLARAGLEAYNTWASQTLAPHIDRLIPIALIDVSDVDWAVSEITRMRRAGSRAFQVRVEPVNETKSLAHPDLDPIWSAAADLGMAVVFHIGAGRGELKRGWFFNGGDPSHFALLHLVHGGVVPQIALAAMLIEGVFERHPGLVVMVQELGISWLPHFIETIDSITVGAYGKLFGMGPGDYKLPLKPSEYLRRQVRVTPLVSADSLRPTLDLVPPEMLVFSSDFPHQEGRSDAVRIFDEQLREVDEGQRSQFFGASISDLLDF